MLPDPKAAGAQLLCGARAQHIQREAGGGWRVDTAVGISPANEDPVSPQDVQPEELDVAIAVDRIETATMLRVRQVRRKWAGLRSFVADKSPVVGFAPDAPGFFWLAGQGGYGIQTAPGMGELAAALGVRLEDLPARRLQE